MPLAAAACLLLAVACNKRAPAPAPGLLRLAFAANLIKFDLRVGEQASRDVRLAGLAAPHAQLAIASVEGGATAALLPAQVEEGQLPGIRLSFAARQPGEGEGRVTVTTGMSPPEAPKRLVLFYSWKVGAAGFTGPP